TTSGGHGVLESAVDPGPPYRRRGDRLCAEPIVRDRYIVRREIPRCIDVHADRAKVRPHHRDVEDPSELARIEVIPNVSYAGVVDEDMTNHQHTAARTRKVAERHPL